MQWSLVKGSTVCDVCRTHIANLPELPADHPMSGAVGGEGGAGDVSPWDPLSLGDPPSLFHHLVDGVRVFLLTLVISVLFFDVTLSRAFVIGGVVGVVFTAVARALAIAQRSAAAVHAFARALQERAWMQHGRQQQMAAAAAATAGEWGGEVPAEGDVEAGAPLAPLVELQAAPAAAAPIAAAVTAAAAVLPGAAAASVMTALPPPQAPARAAAAAAAGRQVDAAGTISRGGAAASGSGGGSSGDSSDVEGSGSNGNRTVRSTDGDVSITTLLSQLPAGPHFDSSSQEAHPDSTVLMVQPSLAV